MAPVALRRQWRSRSRRERFDDVEFDAKVWGVQQRQQRAAGVPERELRVEQVVDEPETLDLNPPNLTARDLALLESSAVQADDLVDLVERGLRDVEVGLCQHHAEVRTPHLELETTLLVLKGGLATDVPASAACMRRSRRPPSSISWSIRSVSSWLSRNGGRGDSKSG